MSEQAGFVRYLTWQVRMATMVIVVTVVVGVGVAGVLLRNAERDLRVAQQVLYQERYALPARSREAIEQEAAVLDARRHALIMAEIDQLRRRVSQVEMAKH